MAMDVLLESNPWGNPWYGQSRRHSLAARRGHRRSRNPVASIARGFGLQNVTQGVGAEEVLGAVGGFSASLLVPPMLIKNPSDMTGKLLRVGGGIAVALLAGMAVKTFSPKAARGVIIGGLAGTAATAIQAFTPLKVMGMLPSGRLSNAQIVNFPRDEQSETVNMIQP